MNKLSWSAVGSSVLVVCAVVVTVLVVFRELNPVVDPPPAGQQIGVSRPLDGWGTLVLSGHSRGNNDSRMTMVVFEDFECPACRAFALGQLSVARERYGDQLHQVSIHWPMPYHRFAKVAAEASECAGIQGRFWEFHDELFEVQDSLGVLPMDSIAARAGIVDLAKWQECIGSTDGGVAVEALDAVEGLPDKLGLKGTPSIVINGRLLEWVPTTDQLLSILDSLDRGHSPLGGAPQ